MVVSAPLGSTMSRRFATSWLFKHTRCYSTSKRVWSWRAKNLAIPCSTSTSAVAMNTWLLGTLNTAKALTAIIGVGVAFTGVMALGVDMWGCFRERPVPSIEKQRELGQDIRTDITQRQEKQPVEVQKEKQQQQKEQQVLKQKAEVRRENVQHQPKEQQVLKQKVEIRRENVQHQKERFVSEEHVLHGESKTMERKQKDVPVEVAIVRAFLRAIVSD